MLKALSNLIVVASYLEEAGGISITRWNMMNSKEKKEYVEKHPTSKYATWDMFKKDIDNDGMFYNPDRNKKKEVKPENNEKQYIDKFNSLVKKYQDDSLMFKDRVNKDFLFDKYIKSQLNCYFNADDKKTVEECITNSDSLSKDYEKRVEQFLTDNCPNSDDFSRSYQHAYKITPSCVYYNKKYNNDSWQDLRISRAHKYKDKNEAFDIISKYLVNISNNDRPVIYKETVAEICRLSDISLQDIKDKFFNIKKKNADKDEKENLKSSVSKSFEDKIVNKNYSFNEKDILAMIKKCKKIKQKPNKYSMFGGRVDSNAVMYDAINKSYTTVKDMRDENEKIVENNFNQIAKLLYDGKKQSDLTYEYTNKKQNKEFKERLEKANDFLQKLIGKDLYKEKVLEVKSKSGRAHYTHADGIITVEQDDTLQTIFHETMHNLEHNNKRIGEASKQFLEYRTKGENAYRLSSLTGRNYGRDEIAKQDEFFNPYCGKIYKDNKGELDATEIMSMGIERLVENPEDFYKKDPEYFNFVLMNLKGEF